MLLQLSFESVDCKTNHELVKNEWIIHAISMLQNGQFYYEIVECEKTWRLFIYIRIFDSCSL